MPRFPLVLGIALGLGCLSAPVAGQGTRPSCKQWDPASLRQNPTESELRCRYDANGPGRFGLLSYADVPVYQPDTPMPGTHVVGIPGHARPMPGESYEEWEWRMLRTTFGPSARTVRRGIDLLHPRAAARIMHLERRLREERVPARRLETWRSRERQAFLFQQGRSRPGPLATTTLTSWHSEVDSLGRPAGRAVDYDVPTAELRRFHALVREVGLESFGADSNDPGHVFLPGPDGLRQEEVILLRVLPRVPEVTLATGIPVDQLLPPGGRAYLRLTAFEFAMEPFLPRPAARLARSSFVARMATRHARTVEPPAPACTVTRGWRRLLSGGGGARCEPPRSASIGRVRLARNTGG